MGGWKYRYLTVKRTATGFRTIEAGEESIIDYGKEYFEQFIQPQTCKCDKGSSTPDA